MSTVNLCVVGWRPGRSIVVCSWDAEEYGLIGSTEWVQVSNNHRVSLLASE